MMLDARSNATLSPPADGTTPSRRLYAISLWQPWASLIALGLKRFETRSWPLRKYSPRMSYAIHAAKRWTKAQRDLCEFDPIISRMVMGLTPITMPLGAYVAIVTFGTPIKI